MDSLRRPLEPGLDTRRLVRPVPVADKGEVAGKTAAQGHRERAEREEAIRGDPTA